ncbi:MAG: c-type cytochrome [Sulfurospirillaceae bacterium]|nr:c-type cytochrome [Sulfurospirillaceae bacterium]
MKTLIFLFFIFTSTSLFSYDGAVIFNKCAKCHGIDGKHKAFGKSAKIAGAPAKQTIAVLEIFKNMSRVDKFAKVMNKEVSKLNEEQIKAVAEYISKLK